MIEDFFKSEQMRINELIEEAEKLIYHKGEEGRECESILKLFLTRYLPKKYSVGSGLIISKDKNLKSKQVDVILYDRINSPLIAFYESLELLPIECVYSGIEVKKRLNKNQDIYDILEKIEKIKSLPKKDYIVEKKVAIPVGNRIQIKSLPEKFETLGFGFVFLTKPRFTLQFIQEKIVNYYNTKHTNEEHKIDIFCVLKQGLIIRRRDGIKRIETKEHTLLTFLLLLIRNLPNMYVGTIDLYSRVNFEPNYVEIDKPIPFLSHDE